MTKLDRLGGILREVEAPLGRALQEHSPLLSWLDSDLQLAYSQCGIATAALQKYLTKACAVDTDRLINESFLPVPKGTPDYEIRHVVLQTKDNQVICPTFTQFYGLVGLGPELAQSYTDMRALLPQQKIALFAVKEAEVFGENLGKHAVGMRDEVKKVLSTRALDFFHGNPEVYEDAPAEIVIAGYQAIWRPEAYRSFPFATQVAEPGGDSYDACIRAIVDTI